MRWLLFLCLVVSRWLCPLTDRDLGPVCKPRMLAAACSPSVVWFEEQARAVFTFLLIRFVPRSGRLHQNPRECSFVRGQWPVRLFYKQTTTATPKQSKTKKKQNKAKTPKTSANIRCFIFTKSHGGMGKGGEHKKQADISELK